MITGNEAANPFFTANEDGYGNAVVFYSPDGSKQYFNFEPGLTIRQHLSVIAMQGLLSNDEHVKDDKSYPETTADLAVQYADALIAEWNKAELNGQLQK